MWKNTVDLFVTYMGSGIMVAWFLLSLVYLYLKEKDSVKRIVFLYFPVIVLVLFFNPLFAGVVYGFIGEEIYYRFLWIIPMSLTISFAAVRIWGGLKRKMQPLFAGFCVLLVMLSGKLIYTNQFFSAAENVYHVPQAVAKICDAISVEGREVMAAFPINMVQYVRQYDATICIPHGRDAILQDWALDFPLLDILLQEEIDVEELVYLTRDVENGRVNPCHFFIVREGTDFIGSLEAQGIVLFDTIEGYDVYYDTTLYLGF